MTFPRLPVVGLLSYNEFVFPDDVTETLSFSITPIPDEARRTVVACDIALEVSTFLTGESTNDTTDTVIRAAIATLSKNGELLKYRGRGFSDLDINTGKRRDIRWGPWPEVVACEPVGAGRVTKLRWKVKTTIPVCGDALFQGIYEFNYRLSFELDYAGYTTRKYAGHIRVAATRPGPGSTKLPDTADKYREKIVPPMPPGFKRTDSSFELDLAKTTCRFSITDEQIPPNAPFPDVVKADADHEYSTGSRGIFAWTGRLSGNFELSRNASADRAYLPFLTMLQDRLVEVKKMVPGEGTGKTSPGDVAPIPVQFSIADSQIFGRTSVRITCQYLLSGIALSAILRAGGLWKKPAQTSWGIWQDSMKNILGPRGHAALVFNEADDAIVDLCGPSPISKPGRPTGYPESPGHTYPSGSNYPVGPLTAATSLLKMISAAFPAPTTPASWIAYHMTTRIETDTGNVAVKALPTGPLSQNRRQPAWDAMEPPPGQVSQAGHPFPPVEGWRVSGQGSQSDTTVQQRTSPHVYVYLRGVAIRAGYQVPCPELVSVGGKAATLMCREGVGEGFEQTVVANYGTPVYRAEWNLRYLLTEPRGAMPTNPNPNLA